MGSTQRLLLPEGRHLWFPAVVNALVRQREILWEPLLRYCITTLERPLIYRLQPGACSVPYILKYLNIVRRNRCLLRTYSAEKRPVMCSEGCRKFPTPGRELFRDGELSPMLSLLSIDDPGKQSLHICACSAITENLGRGQWIKEYLGRQY